MAKALAINAVSKRKTNNLGDIVAVFPDSHVFTSAENSGFDVVSIPSFSDKQVKAGSLAAKPDMSSKIKIEPGETSKTFLDVARPKYDSQIGNPLAATIGDVLATNWDEKVPAPTGLGT